MKSEYESFFNRILKAKTKDDLASLERSLDRLFNAGIFTVKEFSRLDLHIFKRLNSM